MAVALGKGEFSAQVFTVDGEGYPLTVQMVNLVGNLGAPLYLRNMGGEDLGMDL